MKLLEAKNIHFVGIGGIGSSSLAQIIHAKGIKITGSDMCYSNTIKSLRNNEIKVTIGHDEKNLPNNADFVVYSPAIPKTNPELKKAEKLKIKCLSYPQALGELTKDHYTIAIAGAHGKSTTTAMVAKIMTDAGLDPSVVIGTKMREFNNRNFRVGDSEYLVIEACEYKRSFLNFYPNILIITNIEADHLDYYKDLADYKSAFTELAKKVPRDGAVIINTDDKNSVSAVEKIKAQIVTWSHSRKNTDYYLENDLLKYKNAVKELNKKSEQQIKIHPKAIGKHNIFNGCFAAIAAKELEIENKKIEQSLRGFKGTWRRLEIKSKKIGKAILIDDYAHHPTEIQTSLKAIREAHPKARILCIFQPHQYSRTRLFLKGFGKSFGHADAVIIPNIYKVRDSEAELKAMSADILVNEIKKHHKDVGNGNGLRATANYVKANSKKYDIIVTMGAGDIEKMGRMF